MGNSFSRSIGVWFDSQQNSKVWEMLLCAHTPPPTPFAGTAPVFLMDVFLFVSFFLWFKNTAHLCIKYKRNGNAVQLPKSTKWG